MSPELDISEKCEQPILQTGWGLYHYFALGVACACAFAQGTAWSCLPFAIPLTICDASIQQQTIVIVDVCFSFGMAFGGFFFSSVSDVSGRKCMIPMSLMMIFGSTFACGFAHGPVMIIICLFILGTGLITNANSVKIHLAEILPANKRGFYLTCQDVFWTIGCIIGALTAWILTPTIILHKNKELRLATWRLIFGLSGVSSIIVACASALLLPSPRFLLFSKKYPEALDTLKRIYAINNSRHCETFTVYQPDLEDCVDDFNINNNQRPITCTEYIITIFRRLGLITSHLLRKRFIRLTGLLVLYKFVVTFELIAVTTWLTKMLQNGDESDCHFNAVDILHMENVTGCVTCAVTSFVLGYVHNAFPLRLLSAIGFMMAYSSIDSTLNIIIIEAYPTAFRGTAAGLIPFFARFTCGFIKRYLDTPCSYSFTFMGTVMLGATALCYFLPELRGKPMVE
ncbi:hypothetical protein FQR65_LT06212 [Abscondita terminalis]|nr:hypothetical protein FQR65_LT06212 [Abscondita terminalis]